jgi:hypothetical protein
LALPFHRSCGIALSLASLGCRLTLFVHLLSPCAIKSNAAAA